MKQYPLIGKGLVVGIILLYIGTAILSSTGQTIDKQFMLISRGNILYVGGNGPGNYSWIQDAIDNASTDDTVFVYRHTMPYYENLLVDKSLCLIGEDKNTTIIDGNGIRNVTLVTADNVIISGFTLQHSGEYNQYGYSDSGVFLLSNGNTITGNIITDNRNNICTRDSMNNTIVQNIISNNLSNHSYDGIDMSNSSKNRIENNTISGSVAGIDIENGSENSISDNIFRNCLIISIYFSSCDDNRIYHNTIIKNKVDLPSNIGYDSVWMSTSNYTLISENTFVNTKDNTHNIMMTDCYNNTIVRNNFFNVHPYVYFAESSHNVWDGNYWARARFLPKIILGQKGIYDRHPTALNFDWHPAQKPYEIPEMGR
jgi:parallel beta-helix repeat protein